MRASGAQSFTEIAHQQWVPCSIEAPGKGDGRLAPAPTRGPCGGGSLRLSALHL